jgi:cell division protein FtsZ
MEAAQEAISSPLLDNISIQGAAGVLVNITGGMDLALDEVNTISSVIQDAAGEEAEIIFGAVHDPNMKEEVRVTVIATGFEKDAGSFAPDRLDNVIRADFRSRSLDSTTTRTTLPPRSGAGAGAPRGGGRAPGPPGPPPGGARARPGGRSWSRLRTDAVGGYVESREWTTNSRPSSS